MPYPWKVISNIEKKFQIAKQNVILFMKVFPF